jgi:exopolysaccharide biosynthesis polyprenyl glycosylphosphotransferase
MASLQTTPGTAEPLSDFFARAARPEARTVEGAALFQQMGFCLRVLEQVADVLAVVAAVYCGNEFYLRLGWGQAHYRRLDVVMCGAGFGLLFVILLERHGAYRASVSLLAIRETERVLRATLEGLLVALVIAYFSLTPVSRLLILISVLCVPLFVMVEKLQSYRLMQGLRKQGIATRRTVILGAGAVGRRIYSALLRSPRFGLEPVAFVDDDPEKQGLTIYESSYQRKQALQVQAGPVCPELLRELRASVVVIAAPGMSRDGLRRLTEQVAAAGASTYFVPTGFLEAGYWIDYTELDGTMLAHFSDGSRPFHAFSKRVLDLSIAIVALLVFGPLLAGIALGVKLSSAGPVFFRQLRVGQNGVRFEMYKFRTMFTRAPQYARSPESGMDPRITSLGRWLRRLSLDELPQLINVLWGEMSLVGPRPEMPFIVERYTTAQRRRLVVKPGITGLWQLSADRDRAIHENLEYDLYYVRNRSLWMDCAILLHTFIFAARGI